MLCLSGMIENKTCEYNKVRHNGKEEEVEAASLKYEDSTSSQEINVIMPLPTDNLPVFHRAKAEPPAHQFVLF